MIATLLHDDCIDALRSMPDESVDSIVTDPPYELGFMNRSWDSSGIAYSLDLWRECLRVLKPGGHLLAFSSARTCHRMVCAIEDAGFEIRDQIMWVYGSGFPKSLDVPKAIEKMSEAKATEGISASSAEDARQWRGWGTALKPAHEPICVARKPLVGTVAANVLAYGTGALNIDGCRVGRDPGDVSGWSVSGSKASDNRAMSGANYARDAKPDAPGRFPANLIHDGSDDVLAAFPQAPGQLAKAASGGDRRKDQNTYGAMTRGSNGAPPRADAGSAARFFYCAKASKKDRGEENTHPTVKPTELMRYLCRLVTPPGGTVLDPFMGSGSTGKAAILEGFSFVGVEREEAYFVIAQARLAKQNALINPEFAKEIA